MAFCSEVCLTETTFRVSTHSHNSRNLCAGNDPDTNVGPGDSQWQLAGYGNQVAGPCSDGSVFIADSGNFVIKRVQFDAEGLASTSRVAGTGTRAASSSSSTQGVTATSVALGSIAGFTMEPSTCDVYFTERVRRAVSRPTSTQLNLTLRRDSTRFAGWPQRRQGIK